MGEKTSKTNKPRKKITLNPFILQELFTSESRVEADLEYVSKVVSKFLDLSEKDYMDRNSFRLTIVKPVAEESGLRGRDLSKIMNDLMRLGVVVGVIIENDMVRISDVKAGYRAKYVTIAEHVRKIIEYTKNSEKLRILMRSYAGNIVVNNFLKGLLELSKDDNLIEYDLDNELGIVIKAVSTAIKRLVSDKKITQVNNMLIDDLLLLAELLETNDNMKKRFIRGVLKPLSILSLGETFRLEKNKFIIYRDQAEKLLTEYDFSLNDIVRAYCDVILRAGYKIASIGPMGPKVAIKTIAKTLGMDFSKILSFILELAKYDRRIIYEKSVVAEGDMRHGIRIQRDLLIERCKGG